ncbi:MAG: SGNH/GDSL hydrolase family protein [Planctomycetota bacterium]
MPSDLHDGSTVKPALKKKPPLLFKLLAVLISLIGTLIVAEAVFRVAGVKGLYLTHRIDTVIPREGGPFERVPNGFIPFATIQSRYDTDPRDYFDKGGILDHHFNSIGWRDEEHEQVKTPGVYRILALGDSYTFGQGVRLEQICIKQITRRLANDLPGQGFEGINAGLSAYNTGNERKLLAEKGVLYGPDLVIVNFVPNDLEEDVFHTGPKVVFYTEYTNTYMTPDALCSYSYLWSWMRQQYLRSVRGGAYIQQCLGCFQENSAKWLLCKQSLEGIFRLCKKNNILCLVAIWPFYIDLDGDYLFQPIHDLVSELCKVEGIHVIDLREIYKEFNGPELWVHPMDQHPNEMAHKMAADAIADYLLSHKADFRLDRQ